MEAAGRPTEVTEELLSNALGGAKIVGFDYKSAVEEGENFLSTILRVDVTYRKEGKDSDDTIKLIVKSFPHTSFDDVVNELDLMRREQTCYYDILPHMSEVLGKDIFPKHVGPLSTGLLILEDLSVDGYKMLNRIERMDLKHCEAAVKTLADLHAASFIAYAKDPKIFDDLKRETLYIMDSPTQRTFCKLGFTALADEFEKIPDLKKYSTKLRAAVEGLWDNVVEAVKIRESEVNVMAHGDFWTCNLLFQYDDNDEIQDVKLLDFQMSRFSSPVIDLVTFFNTSVQRRTFLPNLVRAYMARLNEVVGRKIISEESLEPVISRYNCVGLLVAVCRLPMCILEISNPMNYISLSKETLQSADFNPYRAASMDKHFQEIIPHILDYYIEVGIL